MQASEMLSIVGKFSNSVICLFVLANEKLFPWFSITEIVANFAY